MVRGRVIFLVEIVLSGPRLFPSRDPDIFRGDSMFGRGHGPLASSVML